MDYLVRFSLFFFSFLQFQIIEEVTCKSKIGECVPLKSKVYVVVLELNMQVGQAHPKACNNNANQV
jgi:hypothetical protein